nr:MAG TPA: hypothetical protein [Caudoviricetes sp.]
MNSLERSSSALILKRLIYRLNYRSAREVAFCATGDA